ncbi:MAG: hypothetical protein OEW05_11745 [Candidatus Aminicenantes bacterium]|nr:hypothetical protein [Candidatus Aminicenantes bacterium]
MDLATYVRLATEEGGFPVPLKKGLSEERLKSLLAERTAAFPEAKPAASKFPLLVLGQGLYYESPLAHFVLCEFLASHGYVVATCPLVGTQYRLVNLNAEDLETQIRDMEFALAKARELTPVDLARTGIIGYDLGGMAGLTLSMRRPEVAAFLSLDAGILTPHRSGLPASHPSYREDRFVIPWMHMTQARFIEFSRKGQAGTTLADRKKFGDRYLVHVSTTNHGQFSSYAMLGITDAVPGYWGPVESDPRPLYEAICSLALDFFNGYLRSDTSALAKLNNAAQSPDTADPGIKVEYKKGQTPPSSEAEFVHLIIEKGVSEARPIIDRARAAYPNHTLCSEGVLNWLGYHFLYWWGREKEAVEVFELNISFFPRSANAYDSLGEAYLAQGEIAKGIASYRKSLELNPQNKTAAEVIKKYEKR